MDKYIEVDRPRLLGPTRSCKAVWVSRDKRGPALRSDSIRDAFIRIGRQMIGRPLSPHQVRYAAATTLLTRDPRVGKLVSALLTHDDERSVPECYDQSGDAAAQAIWRDLKKEIRGTQPIV